MTFRRTQDRHHRRPAHHMIDVHRRKAALVVMRVPERELLGAMRRAEGIADTEDLQLARLHRRAELIEQSRGEPRRLGLARRILQTADGRLRGQRLTALRTAAASFISGSCRNRSRSMASSCPQAIAKTRDTTISNIACRMRSGSRRSGMASASRGQTPCLRSACRRSSKPPLEDWLPPAKST
jgi:hypothetical protein